MKKFNKIRLIESYPQLSRNSIDQNRNKAGTDDAMSQRRRENKMIFRLKTEA